MLLIPALLKDEALITEMDLYINDRDHFSIWWLGQSGYLLQWNRQRVLIDPYLSDSLTTKYAGTANPHERISERVVDPSLFRNITVVTSSHNHTDHLDAQTLLPVFSNNPAAKFLIPEANRAFVAERISCDPAFPKGLNDGASISISHFTFHGIPARHNEIDRDERGNCRYMGYVISFGKWNLYHSGDTLWFDDIVDILLPYKIDLALLPINGNDPSRGVAGNLDVKEAALLAKRIGAQCVIPCHYDMFRFNTADPKLFVKEAQSIDQHYAVLQGGERWNSSFL